MSKELEIEKRFGKVESEIKLVQRELVHLNRDLLAINVDNHDSLGKLEQALLRLVKDMEEIKKQYSGQSVKVNINQWVIKSVIVAIIAAASSMVGYFYKGAGK